MKGYDYLVASKHKFVRLVVVANLTWMQGCVSPSALDHAVIAYDQSTSEILSELLLLNIARAHQHQPLHFTGVSNIAATFNFQFNAGATPAVTGPTGSLITPIFGGTVSENPTISIVPMEGEEFTKRLLTPFQESKLTMLLRQGADVDLILRLLAGELRIENDHQDKVYNNKPSDKDGYKLFRQVVSHISSIQDRNALFVEPLLFDSNWDFSTESLSPERQVELLKEFKVDYNADKHHLTLSKRVTGHIILTNYDPQSLSNEERIKLNEEADNGASNDVMVDIRPGYPGGEVPLHGFFRLRSFYNIVNFIGRDISDEPEFNVDKDPRSPFVSENPIHTLEVLALESEPDDVDMSITYGGLHYAVKPEEGYQWNRESFRLLHQIFQMTMTELSQQGAPEITISK
ncbi:hypothetical protein [Methylomonas koyamae]|uniref:hypothetical protein n=1 Tax=Methylomonas koyamae TaxID=702114 RepID=UPI0021B412DB|nr:hypothetical protein [Methylomonas koyamae]